MKMIDKRMAWIWKSYELDKFGEIYEHITETEQNILRSYCILVSDRMYKYLFNIASLNTLKCLFQEAELKLEDVMQEITERLKKYHPEKIELASQTCIDEITSTIEYLSSLPEILGMDTEKLKRPGNIGGCDAFVNEIQKKVNFVKPYWIVAKAFDEHNDFNFVHCVAKYKNMYFDILTPKGTTNLRELNTMSNHLNKDKWIIRPYFKEID